MNINRTTVRYLLVLIIFWEVCKEYIPNVLSWSRIPVTILLTISVIYESHVYSLLLAIYLAWSDWADGYYARKWKVEGKFGANLDAFVDKLILIPMWFMIATCDLLMDDLHLLIYLMIVRELWIIALRLIRGKKSKSLDSAKWKTGVQFAIIIIYPIMHLISIMPKVALLIGIYCCFFTAVWLSIKSAYLYTFRPVWD